MFIQQIEALPKFCLLFDAECIILNLTIILEKYRGIRRRLEIEEDIREKDLFITYCFDNDGRCISFCSRGRMYR